ncbi:MAG: Release factor glutamine methyltransferase [Chlamydiae bacterium]|nr:Release factor glutamine methyltransferase [Chlamydiota bacterium]
MKRLLEIIQLSASFLEKKGIERARFEAEEVIADALLLKRLDLYLQFDRPLIEQELASVRERLQRRANREPLAYIHGRVTFGGLTFEVNPSVLIPRPETEILLATISETLSKEDVEGKVLWDVCAGSGCLGLCLKHRFPALTVVLSDLSPAALEVAKRNAGSLGLLSSVTFLEGDLFAPFSGMKCDYFVSNPPYITEEEYRSLAPEVREQEPKMALVSGVSGYEMYEKIASGLPHYLAEGGRGWLEMGTGQGDEIVKIFSSYDLFGSVASDYAGHDRFFFLEKSVGVPVR